MKAELLLGVVLLAGCTIREPQKVLSSSNAGYQVDELFTDPRGTTIYRFYDKGDWRYYAVGANGLAQMLPTTKGQTEDVYQGEMVITQKGSRIMR